MKATAPRRSYYGNGPFFARFAYGGGNPSPVGMRPLGVHPEAPPPLTPFPATSLGTDGGWGHLNNGEGREDCFCSAALEEDGDWGRFDETQGDKDYEDEVETQDATGIMGFGLKALAILTWVTKSGAKRIHTMFRPEDDPLSDSFFLHGTLKLSIIEAKGLETGPTMGNPAYVVVKNGKCKVMKTWRVDVQDGIVDAAWGCSRHLFVVLGSEWLRVIVKVDRKIGHVNSTLGEAWIDIQETVPGQPVDDWWSLGDRCGQIHVRYEFTPVSDYHKRNHPTTDVHRTYFTPKRGNRVTPFMCAKCPPRALPTIQTDLGAFEAASCWEDIHEKLCTAQKFIYVCGWSVWTSTKLLRRPGCQNEETLGEILKRRAREGVRVCVMIWDDMSSVKHSLLLQKGMMMTHDEETEDFFLDSEDEDVAWLGGDLLKNLNVTEDASKAMKYFKSGDSKVYVAKVPRPSGLKTGSSDHLIADFIFTHHQKTVCLDHKGRGVAYVGGIDLTDARFCTPDHPLFRTLQSDHAEDFHQAMVQGVTVETGPRQPWQDIHSLLEGPIVRDVVQNFENRWRKQAPEPDALLDLRQVDFGPMPKSMQGKGDWSVQLFRSIDSSCMELPGGESGSYRLQDLEGRLVERSIHQAYVVHIRRAERFLYIENQYFIGSSHLWAGATEGAENLVPAEIALKCAQKVRERMPFHAYINIPMWPEGLPASIAIQADLHSQFRTVQMMYRIVALAIQETHGDMRTYHPTDYLSFYCLVNRETKDGSEQVDEEPDNSKSDGYRMWEERRAPIYIHSKFMVVDDEYMIIGSANINDRSLNGLRDTEIAIGASQPELGLGDEHGGPRGAVQAFRMQVWSSHLGIRSPIELDEYRNPQEPVVVKKVQSRARLHWGQYLNNYPVEMHGHLVPYPYDITRDGEVLASEMLEGHFPDTKASIIGEARHWWFPDMLIF